jgi:serine/threonine protein kinase
MSEFEIKGILGQGTHGVVHHIHRPSSGEDSALKSSDNQADIIKEALVLKGVDSPYLITLKSIQVHEKIGGSKETVISLELEKMDGVADIDKMTLTELKTMLRHVGAGIHDMHLNGITHGDLKPDNILTGSTGYKISDFGLCNYRGLPKKIRFRSSWHHGLCGTRMQHGFNSIRERIRPKLQY